MTKYEVFRQSYETKGFGAIDGAAADAHGAMLKGGEAGLTPVRRNAWLRFLATLDVRHPKCLQRALSERLAFVEALTDEMSAANPRLDEIIQWGFSADDMAADLALRDIMELQTPPEWHELEVSVLRSTSSWPTTDRPLVRHTRSLLTILLSPRDLCVLGGPRQSNIWARHRAGLALNRPGFVFSEVALESTSSFF